MYFYLFFAAGCRCYMCIFKMVLPAMKPSFLPQEWTFKQRVRELLGTQWFWCTKNGTIFEVITGVSGVLVLVLVLVLEVQKIPTSLVNPPSNIHFQCFSCILDPPHLMIFWTYPRNPCQSQFHWLELVFLGSFAIFKVNQYSK